MVAGPELHLRVLEGAHAFTTDLDTRLRIEAHLDIDGNAHVTVQHQGHRPVRADVEAERTLAQLSGVPSSAVLVADALRLIRICWPEGPPAGWDDPLAWVTTFSALVQWTPGPVAAFVKSQWKKPSVCLWAVHPDYLRRAVICRAGTAPEVVEYLRNDPTSLVSLCATKLRASR